MDNKGRTWEIQGTDVKKKHKLVDKQRQEILDILQEVDNNEDLEKQLAENIALVEYYYGVIIDGNFPIMKRFNMEEHIQKFVKMDFDNMSAAVGNAIAKSFK